MTLLFLIPGFVLFMGGALDMIVTQGEPMSHEEVEDLVYGNRDLAAEPYTWCAFTSSYLGKNEWRAGGRRIFVPLHERRVAHGHVVAFLTVAAMLHYN